jgi:hypothetical protein
LGIVLLGALASVHDACIQLVGEQAHPEMTVAEVTSVVPEAAAAMPQKNVTRASSKGTPGVAGQAVDLGQVVSREEMAAIAAVQSAKVDEPLTEPLVKRKKKDLGQSSATNTDIPVPSSKSVGKLDKMSKDKKKKKKKSKGDEFDSLFSSLV